MRDPVVNVERCACAVEIGVIEAAERRINVSERERLSVKMVMMMAEDGLTRGGIHYRPLVLAQHEPRLLENTKYPQSLAFQPASSLSHPPPRSAPSHYYEGNDALSVNLKAYFLLSLE